MVFFFSTEGFSGIMKKLWSNVLLPHENKPVHPKISNFFSKIKKKHPKVHANEQFQVQRKSFLQPAIRASCS